MSGPSATDRNMLFGILALQRGFIRERDLIAAMHTWAIVPQRTLGELLVERRALTEAQAREIDRLADGRAPSGPLPDISQNTPAPRAELPTPGVAERYRILRPHRKGGLGEVFIARDEELGREVALKQIQERWADDPASRQRFLLEARITGGLEHPGVVPVHGLGQHADGRPFYAMRLVQGETLREAIARHHLAPRENRRPPRDLLLRFITVCHTVAYAHSRGVIHRDLKPSNVMLGPFGETLIVDWGLAKVLDTAEAFPVPAGTDTHLSIPGNPVGSPSYMAPEQAAGRLDQIDTRTDVYLLGGILFEILTGQPPHGEGRVGLPAPPVRLLDPKVPVMLDQIVARALEPRRERRYPRAADLAEDVSAWLAGESSVHVVVPATPLRESAPLPGTAPPPAGRPSRDDTESGGEVVCWSVPAAPERFSFLQELAAGRTTLIRLCHDEDLNRLVIIKELRPERGDDTAALASMYREAQLNAQLDHPSIRAIHAVGKHPDGRPFLVLRYLRGQDLHQAVRDYHDLHPRPSIQDAPLRALLTAFINICRAIAYAHRYGVIHGAVRPCNVLVGIDGEAALIDWGESGLVAGRGERVHLADWLEAALPGEQTSCPGGDVFSLGAMLYQILVGRPPHSPLGRVSDRASWVPAELSSLCARAMARDLGGKRLTADELGDTIVKHFGKNFSRQVAVISRQPSVLSNQPSGQKERGKVIDDG